MVKTNIEMVAHTVDGELYGVTLDRCPFRRGKDHRQCMLREVECFYGMTERTIPTECPFNNGIVKIRLWSVDQEV